VRSTGNARRPFGRELNVEKDDRGLQGYLDATNQRGLGPNVVTRIGDTVEQRFATNLDEPRTIGSGLLEEHRRNTTWKWTLVAFIGFIVLSWVYRALT
jgi:hypothetical protein